MSILQELYHKRLSLISQYCPICPIGAHLVWKSPIYKFIIDGELDENEEQICKEIYINVTNSAPPFESPEDVLSNILNQVISLCPKKQKPLILDFGAGKSRNTLYLLEQGYNVRAVEFEEISNGTQQAKEMYEKAQSFGRQFDKLVFPHEFFESKEQFD